MAQTLASIDASLRVIADYVQLLHTEKTGEQVYEVQRYVVGADSEGQPCAWLYGTHPGLNFAVTRVYHDHLHKLPYTISAGAKVWDGEAAPSLDAAVKKGYINAFPVPFSVSLIPTGKKTDAGHPVRRLSRVLPVSDAPPAPPAPTKPVNGNGKPAPAHAAPEPPPWEDFDSEFDSFPSAAQEPVQAAALAKFKPVDAPAARPSIDHEILASIAQLETIKANNGFSGPASAEQWGLLKMLLEKAMGDKTDRNIVLARLAGVEVKTVENPDWRALQARTAAIIDWLVAKQPNGEAIRPLTVAEGRGVDLATVMQGAWGALAADNAPTEDVAY